jgi:hypothetical protein
MFKKTYLAMAIAGISGAVQAGSIEATPASYTAEALAANDEVQIGTAALNLTTTSYASMGALDTLTIDYGAPIKADGGGAFAAPGTLTIDIRSYLTGTYANTTWATNGTLTAGPASATGLTYVVNQASDKPAILAGYATLGLALTSSISLPRPHLTSSSVTSGASVTGTYTRASGTAETATGAVLAAVASQFSAGTVTGNKTIDVNKLKKEFTDGTTATIAVTFNKDNFPTTAVKDTDESLAATNGTVAITLTGTDWSWLDSDATTAGIQLAAGAVTGMSSVTATPTTIRGVLGTTTSTVESASIVISNTEEAAIPVQSITASAEIWYGKETGTEAAVTVAPVGTAVWQLNGSSIDVYAVPQSANASVFLWLTNTGTGTTGEAVNVTIYDDGETCELTSIGNTVPGTEFDLSAAISAAQAVQCPTYVPSGNRVRYNVSSNSPATDLRISAAYRVGTDRVNLLTSSETN